MSEPSPPRGPFLAIVAVVVVIVFVAVKTCDEEDVEATAASVQPEPPEPPEMMSIPPLEPASPLGKRSEPVLSKTTMKRYRVETCYYGSLGVPYARESYWESLGPELPSALKVPSFGAYPEHQPRLPGGRPPVAATIGRLPFEQHLRACSSAKALESSDDDSLLKSDLESFEKYATELARTLSDAARYYAREEYQRDNFKKGLEMHEKLSDELAGFETAHAAFGKAVLSWRARLGPIAEEAKIDKAGKLARAAVAAARELSDALLGGAGSAAIAPLLDAVRQGAKTLAQQGDADPEAKQPRIVGPKLDALLEAADKAQGAKELSSAQRYRIGHAMAELLDAEQRALSQLLGGDEGDGFSDRLRPLAPKLRASARPSARPKPSR